LLAAIAADPGASLAALAMKMGWKLYSGEPNKMKASRVIKALKGAKLVKEGRGGKFKLTDEGKKVLNGEREAA